MADELKAQGNSHFKKGSFKKAIQCFTDALVLDPTNEALLTNRAAAHLKLEQWADAVSDCDKALALCPDNSKAFVRKARALYEMGALEQAQECRFRGEMLEPQLLELKSKWTAELTAKLQRTHPHAAGSAGPKPNPFYQADGL